MLNTIGVPVTTSRGTYVPCLCDCGTPVFIRKALLGKQKTCGCERGRYKHGLSKKHAADGERMYSVWSNMRQRCSNPNGKSWTNYGGRGIRVCDEWYDYVAFRSWALAGGYAEHLTLDRVNNDGDYEPGNCRWATRAEQSRNRRSNHVFTRNGQTKTLKEWASLSPVPYATVYARVIKLEWDIERALTQAPQGAARRR